MFKSAKWLLCMSVAIAMLSAHAGELTVSAAASLTNAFKEIAHEYEMQHTETQVLLNFGGSDSLVQQIAKGAPVDIFASADQDAMDKAQAQKLIVENSRKNFAGNALVVIVPSDSSLNLKALGDLGQLGVKRIALGNPASVPFGRYAKHALDANKLWPILEGKAVYAQNVRQALDYVARDEVDAGFVYATDAAAQKDKVRVAIPVASELPITYPVAIINSSQQTAEARRFIDFLLSARGQTILARHGFLKP